MPDYSKPPPDFGTDIGDLGVIAIAAVFLVGFLYLMFTPSPTKGLDKFSEAADRAMAQELAKRSKDAKRQEIDAAVKSGVVTVGIIPPKKP